MAAEATHQHNTELQRVGAGREAREAGGRVPSLLGASEADLGDQCLRRFEGVGVGRAERLWRTDLDVHVACRAWTYLYPSVTAEEARD